MVVKKKTRTVYRDAGTGRFVSKAYAKQHPETTVAETVEQPKKSEKRK